MKVVSDGMSILEPEQQNELSRVTCSTHLNDSLFSLVVVSVVSLGKSNHHFTNEQSPCIIKKDSYLSAEKEHTSLPSRMEVSSGKATHHLLHTVRTTQNNTRALLKRIPSHFNGFQLWQVYSLFFAHPVHCSVSRKRSKSPDSILRDLPSRSPPMRARSQSHTQSSP